MTPGQIISLFKIKDKMEEFRKILVEKVAEADDELIKLKTLLNIA